MKKAETSYDGALLKTVAHLLGVITGAAIAALAMLILSIFIDVSLPTAFAIQSFAAFFGGGIALRRVPNKET